MYSGYLVNNGYSEMPSLHKGNWFAIVPVEISVLYLEWIFRAWDIIFLKLNPVVLVKKQWSSSMLEIYKSWPLDDSRNAAPKNTSSSGSSL